MIQSMALRDRGMADAGMLAISWSAVLWGKMRRNSRRCLRRRSMTGGYIPLGLKGKAVGTLYVGSRSIGGQDRTTRAVHSGKMQ